MGTNKSLVFAVSLVVLGLAGPVRAQVVERDSLTPEVARVVFFPGAQVDQAFAKGAVLVDGSGGRNYMVHASRREAPGMAEVHTLDTDIVYVLKGSATIVTGGAVDAGKNTAADEIRGTGITGGETRKLAAGDAIIIPNGVPHWFKEVQGPFLYYVVKVR
jgi:glc operon protein GlcG